MGLTNQAKPKKALMAILAAIPLAIAGTMALADSASAAFKLRITDEQTSSATVTAIDNVLNDIDSLTPGRLAYYGSVGEWNFNFTIGTSKPETGTAAEPRLTITSFNANNVGVGDGKLKIELTDTSFQPRAASLSTSVASAVALNGGATLDFNSYLGTGEFDTTYSLSSFTGLTENFAEEDTVLFPADIDTYSLTLVANLYHSSAGLNSSFNGKVTGEPVPEPITLLGSGIALGFGTYLKRKLKEKPKI